MGVSPWLAQTQAFGCSSLGLTVATSLRSRIHSEFAGATPPNLGSPAVLFMDGPYTWDVLAVERNPKTVGEGTARSTGQLLSGGQDERAKEFKDFSITGC